IILAAKRGSEVIGRIRALVKKTKAQKTSLDISEVAEEVAALVHGEARKHGVSLRTELAPALPPIEGDRVQLQQVILNLLMNGIEASEGVKDRPRELMIRSQLYSSDSVLVAVQDAGVGFDPDQMPRLFDAFFTTKPGGNPQDNGVFRTTAAGADGWPMDLSEYAFELVRSDEALALHRGRSGTPSSRRPILLLTPLSGHPTPATVKRLEHEYALEGEL